MPLPLFGLGSLATQANKTEPYDVGCSSRYLTLGRYGVDAGGRADEPPTSGPLTAGVDDVMAARRKPFPHSDASYSGPQQLSPPRAKAP